MKTISTLALLGLLFFACKLCSFSGNGNRPVNVDVSPSPQQLSYARDFIKPQLGRFRLSKSYTKEEARKTASGFTVKMIEQAGDCAGGEYSGGSGTAALMACSYSGPSEPAALRDDIENQIKNDRNMQLLRTVPRTAGKRIEATDPKGRAVVAWNNGHWLFMSIGPNLSDTTALADAIGY